ncbi:MAG: T9SS C-terminal target domain-containing protein [Bacteroidetes bacterium]|nr:MAG: T9SS C-terminal target domain-containing protein [Bacteroidota bacterium]
MKKLNLIFVFTALLTAAAPAVYGQCTPDTTLTSVGLYPDSLPTAYVNHPYSQTLYAALPTDTLIFGINFAFCSYEVTSISPDPATLGLSYQCNVPNCNYVVDPSKPLNFGCVTIGGTPTTTEDTLVISITAVIGTYNPATNTCTPSAPLTIPFKIGFTILPDSSTNSIDTYSLSSVAPSLMPNPASEKSTFTFTMPEAGEVRAELFNLMGQRVQTLAEGNMLPGVVSRDVNLSGLSAGVYTLRLVIGQNQFVHSEKLVVSGR